MGWRIYNSAGTLLNYQGQSTTSLPFPLKVGYRYSIQYQVEFSATEMKIWMFSDDDERYRQGRMLFNIVGSGLSLPKVAWAARDYNDPQGYVAVTGTSAQTFSDVTMGLCTNTPNPAFLPISLVAFNAASSIISEPGYIPRYEFNTLLSRPLIKKINRIFLDSVLDSSATSVRFYCSFNNGSSYKKWNGVEWIAADPLNNAQGMTPEEIVQISSQNFSHATGLTEDQNFILKTVMTTTDPTVSARIKELKMSYNGPYTYDSWDSPGSFYDPSVKFYFNSSGTWNPFTTPDFATWTEMGTDEPSTTILTSDNGSPGSTPTNKVFAGCVITVVPTGVHYWRVAAFNGI
jgi:hypothetical protein